MDIDIEEKIAEARSEARIAALDFVRETTAMRRLHYQDDAKRFADAGSYATAAIFQQHAEANGLICIDIGRELGLSNAEAIKVKSKYSR